MSTDEKRRVRNDELTDGLTKRGKTYWADFRSGGRRIRKSLSKNLKTARQLLIELRARVERGEYDLLDNNCGVEETFSDVDWEARELVVQRGVAKNHMARRIPIEDGLWEILCRQKDGRDAREPGKGKTPKITAIVQEKFTRDHVFVTTQTTPLTHGSGVYNALMRCCEKAGIQTRTVDAEGREIDHVDVHSFRRTFATNLIVNGADPKTVQELLGHKTLAMTMGLYAKIHRGTKRQALGRLSYGSGVQVPDHVVEFPHRDQLGHKMSTVARQAKVAST